MFSILQILAVNQPLVLARVKTLAPSGVEKHFNKDQINAIRNGNSKIPGFTWHHQDTGRMQLVREDLHHETGHIGGASMSRGK